MLTVTQTARVASRIIPKTTQEGITPPLRRTSVRVPIMSREICCTDANEFVRGDTRCVLIRSSTHKLFATLLTSTPPSPLPFDFRPARTFQLHANCGKGEGLRSDGLPTPWPE